MSALSARPIFQSWSAARIAQACGGTLTGDAERVPVGLQNDSRLCGPGDLFVAIVAERDGHDFIPDARSRRARILLVDAAKAPEPWPGESVIAVPDTVQALAALGRALWEEHGRLRPDRVSLGITGSNGKTTTKELTARLLQAVDRDSVLYTAGNLNNHIGLPITLSFLAERHRYVVLEMGASVPGDIAHLVGIAPVRRAAVTSIAAAHLEGLGDEAAVAREKGAIFAGVPAAELAVVPEGWREALIPAGFGGRVAAFGEDPEAAVALTGYAPGPPARAHLRVGPPLAAGAVELEVPLPLLGRHNALNLAAAAALVWDLLPTGGAEALLAAVLEATHPLSGRLAWRRGRGGARLIDDTYNANPGSMRAALAVLAEQAGPRWAVLGDMLELGAAAPAAHDEVGALAARSGCERLWAVGAQSRAVAEGARRAGLAEVATFGDAEACARAARSAPLTAEQVVLVKGSRGVRLERVVAALMEEAG